MSAGILDELEQELNSMTGQEVLDAETFIVPPGLYHAVFNGGEDDETGKGKRFINLSFTLLGGPKPGKKVEAHLFVESDKGDDATKSLRRQINLYRVRLGMAQAPNGLDKPLVSLKRSWDDAAGAECLLKIEVEKYTTQQGRDGEKNAVAMFGIKELSDPKYAGKALFGTEAAKKAAAERLKNDDLDGIEV